ncbi:MAG TPA: hypothetical protein VKJ07_15540, partial [Mycobacteriales bacterium]|nr:hypothetical protein [Mycobacteriales bacterium]
MLGVTAAGVTVGMLLTGCASRQGAVARSSTPPKLHIAHTDVAAAGVGAPMAATAGGPASGRLSFFGEFVLVGSLPDKPTHAPVWRWAGAAATQEEVARVGHAVGVSGTPQRHAHGWLLSSAAGEVRVADTAGHEWSYTRADLRSCSPYLLDIDSEPNGSVSGCATATSSGEQIPNGPDDATSRAAAAPVISGLGLEGAEQVNVGAPSSYVSISPLIGGLQTQGIETSIDIDTTGVRSAHGRLAAPAAGDDYPLRTAKQGFA